MENKIIDFDDVVRTGVRVGGIHYSIKVVDEMAGDTIGATNYEKNLITLKRCELQRMQETLLHELTHIIFFHSGYDEQDERMVSSIASWLYSSLKQNKETFKVILE